MNVVIRPGAADEGQRLKEIAIAAKGFWGYDPAKVKAWAERGDFSPQRLRELIVFVAEADSRPVAWCSLIPKGDEYWLEDLWVEPEWAGRGIGRRLFRHAARHARKSGAKQLEWEAEPNATRFYEKMGARHLRDSKPTEWGRRLSVMGVELDR